MKLTRTTAVIASTLAALLGSGAALAHDATDRIGTDRAEARLETRIEAGPYAKYLQYQGVSKDRAIALAREIGEQPQRQTVRVVVTPLTDLEKYDRAMGRSTRDGRSEQLVAG